MVSASESAGLYKVLSHEQVEFFVEEGYLLLEETFPRDLAERIGAELWRMGEMDPNDPKTWKNGRGVIAKVIVNQNVDAMFTPRFLGALDDLLGEGRWSMPRFSGYLLYNFPGFEKGMWDLTGGHVDGGWFHHRLTSREQAAVALPLFTDTGVQGGGTAVRRRSHKAVARMLAAADPVGLSASDVQPRAEVASRHLPAVEVTGRAGDVVFMHPFTYHGGGSNLIGKPRAASNLCPSYHHPMNVARDNPAPSPVERAIIQAIHG